MSTRSIQKYEDDTAELHNSIQSVINDAVNTGHACDAEVMSALSILLIKASLRAGLSLEEFLEGIELNYYVAACNEAILDDVSH